MPDTLLLTADLDDAASKLTPRELEYLKALRSGMVENSEDAPLLERSISAKLAQQEIVQKIDKSKFTQRFEPTDPSKPDALDSIPVRGPSTKADLRVGDRAMHRGMGMILVVAGFAGDEVKLHYMGKILRLPRESLSRVLPTKQRMTKEEKERYGARLAGSGNDS